MHSWCTGSPSSCCAIVRSDGCHVCACALGCQGCQALPDSGSVSPCSGCRPCCRSTGMHSQQHLSAQGYFFGRTALTCVRSSAVRTSKAMRLALLDSLRRRGDVRHTVGVVRRECSSIAYTHICMRARLTDTGWASLHTAGRRCLVNLTYSNSFSVDMHVDTRLQEEMGGGRGEEHGGGGPAHRRGLCC